MPMSITIDNALPVSKSDSDELFEPAVIAHSLLANHRFKYARV